jgi:cytochrome c553
MAQRGAAWRTGFVRRAAVLSVILAAASAPLCAAGDAAREGAKAGPCADCHGTPQRAPLPGMPYLAGQTAQFVELQLILMREGLRDVPQKAPLVRGLTDSDISDLAAHFARQTPPRNPAAPDPARYRRGAALARAMICANCHGEDYRGQKHLPRLAGQREDYLVASLKAYRENKRTGIDTSMNELMYRVTDSDIEALAHFLAHQ